MLGAIEADRDRRLHDPGRRARRAAARQRSSPAPHPRLAAAIAAERRALLAAARDDERWMDEGGRSSDRGSDARPVAVGLATEVRRLAVLEAGRLLIRSGQYIACPPETR